MLKQMEQPQENQASTGEQQSSDNQSLRPGTIIKPQASPVKHAVPHNPVPAEAKPTPPIAPAPAPKPAAPPEAAKPLVKASRTALNAPPKAAEGRTAVPKQVKPTLEKVPLATPPPGATAVLALDPVQEQLISRPRIEARPAEVKPISPSGTLKNPISTPARQDDGSAHKNKQPILWHRRLRIYEHIPLQLSLTIAAIIVIAAYSLLNPVSTEPAVTGRIIAVVAVLSLILCIGLVLKSNLARSLFVSVTIVSIITQVFVMYKIHTDYFVPTVQVSYEKSFDGYHRRISQWLDPKYHQTDKRLLIVGAETFTVFAITTLSMGRIFDKRP
jgi:hypothetical protein